MSTDLMVSGIGVVTPWSDRAGEAAHGPREAGPEPWFDHRERLGPRGYKYLPSATQYLLAATRQALADAGEPEQQEERRGAAVGTNSAAVAVHTAIDATVVAEGARMLNPATAPYFSINLFGSRLATEHALKGFNLTLTSPRVAGLEAIEAGSRAVGLGRASWLLAGATEEALPEGDPGARTSERGAVALVLEPADRLRARGVRGYGRCAARSFFLPPRAAAGAADRLRGRIAALLTELGLPEGRPHRTVAVVDDSPVAAAVSAALGTGATRVEAGAGSLEPVLQVAGALAEGEGPVAVVTAAGEGNLAVVLATPPERT